VKGNSKAYNSFAPLSCGEIVFVAGEIGVKLGNDQREVAQSIEVIQSREDERDKVFLDGCVSC
jgi:hypothetical protein